MSIADAIREVKTKIDNVYKVLEEAGATIPEDKNLDNLQLTIESKPGGETMFAYYNGTDIEEGKKVFLTKVGYQALTDDTILPDPPKDGNDNVYINGISENGYIIAQRGNYANGYDFIDGSVDVTTRFSWGNNYNYYGTPHFMLNGAILFRSQNSDMHYPTSGTQRYTLYKYKQSKYYNYGYSGGYVLLDSVYHSTIGSSTRVDFTTVNDDLTTTPVDVSTVIGTTPFVFYSCGANGVYYAVSATSFPGLNVAPSEWEMFKIVGSGDSYTSTKLCAISYKPYANFMTNGELSVGLKKSIKIGDNRLHFLLNEKRYLYFAINEVDETQSTFEVCEYPQNIKDILGTRTINKVQTFYDGTFSMDLSEGTTLICKFTNRYDIEVLETIEPFVIEGNSTIYHRNFSESRMYWYLSGDLRMTSPLYYGRYDKVKALSDYLALSPVESRFNSTILTGFLTGKTADDNGRQMIEVKTVTK